MENLKNDKKELSDSEEVDSEFANMIKNSEMFALFKQSLSLHDNPEEILKTCEEVTEQVARRKRVTINQVLEGVETDGGAAESATSKGKSGKKNLEDSSEIKLEQQNRAIDLIFKQQVKKLQDDQSKNDNDIAKLQASRSRDPAVKAEERELMRLYKSNRDIINSGIKVLQESLVNHKRQLNELFNTDPLPPPESVAAPGSSMEKTKPKETPPARATPAVKKRREKAEAAPGSSTTNSVFVTNFAKKTADGQLRRMFNKHGVVLWTSFINGNQIAQVKFSKCEEAQKAVLALNGCEVEGKRWKVSLESPSQNKE